MRLDLITLRLFLAVVDEGGIAKAARREHITGPAISKRIAELEEWLGVQLIERHTRGIKPTSAGLDLAAEARAVLGGIDRIHAKLSDYATGARGEVSIISGASGLVGQLPEDLKQFVRDNPLVKLLIKEQHSPEVVRGVSEGKADIGIYAPSVSAPNLDVYPYQVIRLVVVTSLNHPLAERRSVCLAEAAAYDFIGLSGESALGLLLARVANEHGIQLNPQLEVTGHEPMRRLVGAGLGIGILPHVCAIPYVKAMQLRCIPLGDAWARYTLNICTRPHETLSVSARRLLSHLILRADAVKA
ncbi:MAG TPA: LysR family transcriptional regulator [Burkholderiales bacterium]